MGTVTNVDGHGGPASAVVINAGTPIIKVVNASGHGGGSRYPAVSNPIFSGSVDVPINFVGMHFHRWPSATSGLVSAAPTFPFGTFRTHDYGISWNAIEPTKGLFSWARCDEVINIHFNAGRKIIFTLYGTPTWAATAAGQTHNDPYGYPGGADRPANLTDLSDFISSLASRYNGKIWAIEVWNEPYFTQDWTGFFWGSAAHLSAMARTVKISAKAITPAIKILSPGFTLGGQISDFLNASDGAGGFGRDHNEGVCCHFYNTITVNEYPNQPTVKLFVDLLRGHLVAGGLPSDFPIHDTEHGWLGSLWLQKSESARATELRRIAAVEASMGVQSLCWYAYDNLSTVGTPNIHNSPILGAAIGDCHNVLAGRTLLGINVLADGSWVVTTDVGGVVW